LWLNNCHYLKKNLFKFSSLTNVLFSIKWLWSLQQIVNTIGAYSKPMSKLCKIWNLIFKIPKHFLFNPPSSLFPIKFFCWGIHVAFELRHFMRHICKGYAKSSSKYGWISSLPILKWFLWGSSTVCSFCYNFEILKWATS
jgi:hypothetical protein